jgi:TrpR-related protein YerC/YecD
MRTSVQKLNPSLQREIVRTFVQTIADLKDVEETEIFFKDFFTDSEYESFARRLAIAYWLKKGRSYNNIKENLKVSSATVASVQSDLNKEGIKLALKKIEAEEWAHKWAEKIKKFTK